MRAVEEAGRPASPDHGSRSCGNRRLRNVHRRDIHDARPPPRPKRRVPNTLLSHVMSTVCLPRVSHLSTRLTPRPSTLFFFPLFFFLLLLLFLLLFLFFAFSFVSFPTFFCKFFPLLPYPFLPSRSSFFVTRLLARFRCYLVLFAGVSGVNSKGSNSGFANSWLWCVSMFTGYLLLVKDEEEKKLLIELGRFGIFEEGS